MMKMFVLGLSGDEFHFDSSGDGPARYNILHFKQVQQNVYRWVNVGQYLDGELQLDLDGKRIPILLAFGNISGVGKQNYKITKKNLECE
jgi:hypothetical protein